MQMLRLSLTVKVTGSDQCQAVACSKLLGSSCELDLAAQPTNFHRHFKSHPLYNYGNVTISLKTKVLKISSS